MVDGRRRGEPLRGQSGAALPVDPEIAAERYFDLESGVVQSIPVLEGEQMAEVQPFFTEELLDIFRSLEAQIPPATNTKRLARCWSTWWRSSP